MVKLGSIDRLTASNATKESQAKIAKSWRMELVLFAFIVVISLFFLIFPEIDIWFSDLFHAEEGGFWVKSIPLFNYLREIGPTLVWLVAISSCISLFLYFSYPLNPYIVWFPITDIFVSVIDTWSMDCC